MGILFFILMIYPSQSFADGIVNLPRDMDSTVDGTLPSGRIPKTSCENRYLNELKKLPYVPRKNRIHLILNLMDQEANPWSEVITQLRQDELHQSAPGERVITLMAQSPSELEVSLRFLPIQEEDKIASIEIIAHGNSIFVGDSKRSIPTITIGSDSIPLDPDIYKSEPSPFSPLFGKYLPGIDIRLDSCELLKDSKYALLRIRNYFKMNTGRIYANSTIQVEVETVMRTPFWKRNGVLDKIIVAGQQVFAFTVYPTAKLAEHVKYNYGYELLQFREDAKGYCIQEAHFSANGFGDRN